MTRSEIINYDTILRKNGIELPSMEGSQKDLINQVYTWGDLTTSDRIVQIERSDNLEENELRLYCASLMTSIINAVFEI